MQKTCPISAFCAVDPDRSLKPDRESENVEERLQCPARQICWKSSQINMDDLHMVSISPVIPLKINERKAHKRHIVAPDSLLKSIDTRSFPRSHFVGQSCSGSFTNNTNKWRRRTSSSSLNTFNSGPTDGSAAVCKGDNKDAERNPRKKTKKRVKRNKNLLGCKGITEQGKVDGESMSQNFSEERRSNDSLVLDLSSLGLNSEESCPQNYFKLSDERNDDAGITNLPHYLVSKEISPEDMLIGNGERSSQILGTRKKHVKKVQKNFNSSRRNSFKDVNKLSGKENTNSVWQKVQRNKSEYKHKFGKVNSVCSEIFNETKEVPVNKEHHVDECHMLSKSENKNQVQVKNPGKLKRKMRQGSKKECISHHWKASHSIETFSNSHLKTNILQNKLLDSVRISQRKCNWVSAAQPRTGHHPEKVDNGMFKHNHYTEMSSPNLEAGDRAYIAIPELRDQPAENQANLLLNSCYPLGPSELHEALSALSIQIRADDESAKGEREVPATVGSWQENDPAAALEERTAAALEERNSVGVGDTRIPGSCCGRLSNGELHKLAGKSWSPEVVSEDSPVYNPSPLVLSENVGVTYESQSSEYINNLPFGDECQVQRHDFENHAGATCLTPQTRTQKNFDCENNSNNIISAVNCAHWSQMACEAIEMAAGSPIAEFERFLHSASPVLCTSQDVLSCQTCKPEQVAGTSVCSDKTPNISLGSLWQWYEKPGSYGLEVIAQDCENTNKLGIDRLEFSAYFVPSLSAVQLFRRCSTCPTGKGEMMIETVTEEPEEIDQTVFQTENKTILLQQNQALDSEPPSLCTEENDFDKPVVSKLSDDIELLFEYFECDQPHQRRPLFEMIKELVRGEESLKCRGHGDPSVLEQVDLQDLHQTSWYSVAWYPIYRIPDGNLRAAFLTYHSLGHLVHRNPIYDSSMDTCIVSPVVGLQSYNAQGECWFRPRLQENIETGDTGWILRERLRSLELTASLMARAVTMRGSRPFVNRQPDYEFFLSRRTY